jgi:transcriptional regulator with XRE-family HTH domain
MKNDSFFKSFVETIQTRIPERGKLAKALAEILCIEKEAVYRRLRGSVPFSFQEIYTIALNLGLSLDTIAEEISPVNKQFSMRLIEFLNPNETDYQILDNFAYNIEHLKSDPDSETGAIGSIIPTSLCVHYKYLYKFHLYKWAYQFGNQQKYPTYEETQATEKLNLINRVFVENVQNSPKSVYILDKQFIEYFVNDVQYFFDIKLIEKEDVIRLKEDLFRLLDDIERYAVQGTFDTGKKVEIYLSNVHFETSYNYIDTAMFKVTMIRSFTLSDAYSFDEAMFAKMKTWLYFLKRTSTMISISNVSERMQFFDKQRAIVNTV